MLVVVAFMRGMTVAVVKVVDMAIVLDRGVAAVGTVLVLVLLGLVVPSAPDPASERTVGRRQHEEGYCQQHDGAAGSRVGIERRRHAADAAEDTDDHRDPDSRPEAPGRPDTRR